MKNNDQKITTVTIAVTGSLHFIETKDHELIGDCVVCGNPVIELDDRFTCVKALAGECNFTVSKVDIEEALTSNVDSSLHGLLESDEIREPLIDALSGSKQRVTFYQGDDSLYEYFDIVLAQEDDGKWTVKITRDDPELNAIAAEGYKRYCEQ